MPELLPELFPEYRSLTDDGGGISLSTAPGASASSSTRAVPDAVGPSWPTQGPWMHWQPSQAANETSQAGDQTSIGFDETRFPSDAQQFYPGVQSYEDPQGWNWFQPPPLVFWDGMGGYAVADGYGNRYAQPAPGHGHVQSPMMPDSGSFASTRMRNQVTVSVEEEEWMMFMRWRSQYLEAQESDPLFSSVPPAFSPSPATDFTLRSADAERFEQERQQFMRWRNQQRPERRQPERPQQQQQWQKQQHQKKQQRWERTHEQWEEWEESQQRDQDEHQGDPEHTPEETPSDRSSADRDSIIEEFVRRLNLGPRGRNFLTQLPPRIRDIVVAEFNPRGTKDGNVLGRIEGFARSVANRLREQIHTGVGHRPSQREETFTDAPGNWRGFSNAPRWGHNSDEGGARMSRNGMPYLNVYLNKDIMNASSAEDILSLSDARLKEFNDVNVATALNRLAKVRDGGSVVYDARFGHLVLAAAAVGKQGLATAMWACARLGLRKVIAVG
eukprot:gnl/MRDRNA2_/MRDRNA2_86243_c0_seq3.p1 gnl/MRDRNA2_/MRDRNA2_86243_c0~~gnl/MRDRNA2_/MRDRNA2_86243_c0_seq3.p1  ORF type:complete len:579 (+),score=125.88 gnl/MRDRNA2_/MRDRNA2_86243_c0_seq3:238-1737(+)